jgi:hypothetical protein
MVDDYLLSMIFTTNLDLLIACGRMIAGHTLLAADNLTTFFENLLKSAQYPALTRAAEPYDTNGE